MEIKIIEESSDMVATSFSVGAFEGGDAPLSKGTFRYRSTVFGNGYIKTMTAGAVATPVHLRRGGNVRKIFEYMHKKAYEDGVLSAILHPFSFAYYNKFGYEKVSDHLIVRFPIRYLDFLPRRCTLVPYAEDMLGDIVSVYERFSMGRGLMFERKSSEQFTRYKDSMTYVYYEGGSAEGYITYKTDKTLAVNHYEEGVVTVYELVYTSPSALKELLSFIRMYEGELEDVEFSNLGMTPEVDMLFRNYTHTRYKLLPDIAAKIINTEEMLKTNSYPEKEGALTICVPEGDEGVRGSFKIEWGGGDRKVTRLAEGASVDARISPTALARLLYGYDMLTPLALPYLNGAYLERNHEGFIAAFPKKNVGVFEHF